MKSHLFGKCSHLIFQYIIEYNNISWRSTTPPPFQNLGVATPAPSDWRLCYTICWYAYKIGRNSTSFLFTGFNRYI